MAKSNAGALSSARRIEPVPKNAPPHGVVAADPGHQDQTPNSERPNERPRRRAAGVRLWGFVRRHEDAREKSPDLLPQDIAIWYDNKRCRFEVVADHTVVDDLAPVEFVQFVRALRYSTTQILFKFENRHDGTAGRPVCVWAAPQLSGIPEPVRGKSPLK